MEMVYRILWVEDDDNWYRANFHSVKYLVEGLGFRLHVTRASGRDEMPVQTLWRTYDIVLMDLSLVAPQGESGQDGGDIIKSIRDHQVYTDVVFYSQSGSRVVRARAKELDLDGVFCAGRDDGAFTEKVRDVIGNTIKKVQDINALRGLVVAEAGDVDHMLHEIIGLHFATLQEDQASLFLADLLRRLHEDLERNSAELKKLAGATVEAIIDSRLTTANHLWRAVVGISKQSKDLAADVLEMIANYQAQIQMPRNDLAHCVAVYDEATGTTKLVSRRKKGADQAFTDEWCIEMRQKLLAHRKAFDALRMAIPKP